MTRLTPDTGALETGLQAIARALVQSMTGPVGRAVQTAIFSDAGRLPEVAEGRQRVLADRFRRAAPVVVRAIERGEIPAETDPAELLKTLAAPIYFRLLVTAEPVGEGAADQAVRITLAACPRRRADAGLRRSRQGDQRGRRSGMKGSVIAPAMPPAGDSKRWASPLTAHAE
ncbi:TetR-like C-terminal domain-containing protein [Streptomyces sp. NPDC057686]|uniref:TetR-like C-terminal domain-containing protein n=1 Tax=Streptomyces sp. NPDC057686 TaxID=3346212 RepID=UPI0036A5D545